MKKWILIFLVLFTTNVYAGQLIVGQGGLGQSAGDCSSNEGSELWFFGDHSLGTDYICADNGGTNLQGSYSGASAVDLSADPGSDSSNGGNGLKIDADNDNFSMDTNSSARFTSDQGCFEAEIYIANDDTDGNVVIVEGDDAYNQEFQIYIANTRKIYLHHDSAGNAGAGADVYNNSDTVTVGEDGWHIVKICWNDDGSSLGAGNYASFQVDGGGVTYGTTQIYAFDVDDVDTLKFGETRFGYGGDVFYMDDIKVWNNSSGT